MYVHARSCSGRPAVRLFSWDDQTRLRCVTGVRAIAAFSWVSLFCAGRLRFPDRQEIRRCPAGRKDPGMHAIIETEKGAIGLELLRPMPESANLRVLAEHGYYDGRRVHRIVKGCQIKGVTLGTGNGGESAVGRNLRDEIRRTANLPRWLSARTRRDGKRGRTNGSQFFILHEDFAAAALCDLRASHSGMVPSTPWPEIRHDGTRRRQQPAAHPADHQKITVRHRFELGSVTVLYRRARGSLNGRHFTGASRSSGDPYARIGNTEARAWRQERALGWPSQKSGGGASVRI